MRLFIQILLFLLSTPVLSQDGSDVFYSKPENLNSIHIGKLCHIDFGKSSGPSSRHIDTTQISINGKLISFVERRVDNGFNNWFSEQYLEALPLKKYSSMRITSSRIDSLTSSKIFVTSFISYYLNESAIDTITIIQHSYSRKNVARVLFKAEQLRKE